MLSNGWRAFVKTPIKYRVSSSTDFLERVGSDKLDGSILQDDILEDPV